jgi:hypothetical protein
MKERKSKGEKKEKVPTDKPQSWGGMVKAFLVDPVWVGKTNAEIAEEVSKSSGDRVVLAKDVAWYRSKLVKDGILAK